MSLMKKFFLTIISLIMLSLTGGALYINYWLDNLIAEINTQPALVTTAEVVFCQDFGQVKSRNNPYLVI